MKGHTKIELTNVETGDTEVYEDDNLFTDIFGELVNDNNFGFTAISTSPDTFLPLSTNALGGIALFPEAQTASATHMYPTQAAMAYAGNNTDAGSNVYKGTYNVTESGAITNGYKHVWDFTTSQGNGEIASVSLVHPACGNSWPGNSNHVVKSLGNCTGFMSMCKLINQSAQLFIGYDPASQHIQVRRIETIIDALSSVNAKLFSNSCTYTVEKDIVIDSETDKAHAAAGMVWRIDGTNAIGYGHRENTSGDAYIYMITVDINTLDYTESSITISGTAIGSFGNVGRRAITRNGYLYCRRSSDGKLLKINLSNTTDITEIEDTNYNLGYDEVLDYVLLSGSKYLFPDDSIGTGGSFIRGSGYYPYVPIARIGTKQLVVDPYSSSDNPVSIKTPKIYLGTINNLESPVVKTASQTMKITYTITDSTEVVLRGISVTHAPNTTRFAKGTALDTTGLEVTAAYSGNTTEVVTSSCVLSPANGSTLSDTSVSSIGISFTDGDITRTTSTPITVYAPSSLTVTSQPAQTSYFEGDTLDLTGAVITATYSDGTSADVTNSCTFSPANGATLSSGTSSVSVTYTLGSETVTTSIPITVQAATLSSIAVTTMPTATTFYVGGVLDLTGIVVTATYSDSTTAVVTEGCVFSPANGSTLSAAGSQSISVSYTSGGATRTTSFTVLVSETPSGDSVTPTDNIQTWLACGEITGKSYTTLNEVLSDTTTLQALITDNNACDYMVRSTSWSSQICANETAMSYIGSDDYCTDTLLMDYTWSNSIANSEYFENVLTTGIPIMTSNTAPSGECFGTNIYSGSPYYYAFDAATSGSTSVIAVTPAPSTTPYGIGYKFPNDVLIKKFIILYNYTYNREFSNFYLQGSTNGTDWVDLTSAFSLSSTGTQYYYGVIPDNYTPYQYYRLYNPTDVLHVSREYAWYLIDLRVYGRE